MRCLSPEIRFAPRDRLLVLAPHPDDETIACGELIQDALAARAFVRVVFATDGDNNPWPQRWVEKRILIGAEQRRRWGRRRREEASAALQELGGDAITTRFMGWPDQGLTERLMADDALVQALAGELAGFMPTHLAFPGLGDRHPDHSALHIASQIALLRVRPDCQQLGYLVHGNDAATLVLPSQPRLLARKQAALECHASQLALSRKRLQRLVQGPEQFVLADTAGARMAVEPGRTARIALGGLPKLRMRHDLLVIAAGVGRTWRWRIRSSALACAVPHDSAPANASLRLNREDGAIRIEHIVSGDPVLAAWAKWHRAGPRMVVFDRQIWHADMRHIPRT